MAVRSAWLIGGVSIGTTIRSTWLTCLLCYVWVGTGTAIRSDRLARVGTGTAIYSAWLICVVCYAWDEYRDGDT